MIDADGRNRWKVSFPNPRADMYVCGWSPDGKRILYMEVIGSLVNNTFIIATLNPTRQEVRHFDRVPLPKMSITGGAWGADGKSILITSKPADAPNNDLHWNIYRFHLIDKKLIQLTHLVTKDVLPQEWNPSLSVQPQRLIPVFWGEMKSNRLRH